MSARIGLFVNGAEVDELADGFKISEVVFIPTVPYARPIEAGESKQAQVPREGVYHAVATLARARFGRVAKIDFAWRGVSGLRACSRRSWSRCADGKRSGFNGVRDQARDLVERVDLSGDDDQRGGELAGGGVY
jgi:hypothetical protein